MLGEDLIVSMRGGEVSLGLSAVTIFKIIQDASVDDRELLVSFANPANKPSFGEWEALVHNLNSLGNKDSHEWAEIVKDFCL